MSNLYLESCRVFKECGDGLRLDNFAAFAQSYFNSKAVEITKMMRECKAVAFVEK